MNGAERGADGESWRERAAVSIEHELAPAELPHELLAEVFQHARECYPEECCGLLTGRLGATPSAAVRCTNVQSRRRARGESDLDARRGFWLDEQELARALREAEARGESLVVLYHSHIDTAAYLSHTDVAGALGPDGAPLYPDCAQLVVAVDEGGILEAALFQWEPRAARFRGRRVG